MAGYPLLHEVVCGGMLRLMGLPPSFNILLCWISELRYGMWVGGRNTGRLYGSENRIILMTETFLIGIGESLPEKGLAAGGAGTTGGATIHSSSTNESLITLNDTTISLVSHCGVVDNGRIVVFDLGKAGIA